MLPIPVATNIPQIEGTQNHTSVRAMTPAWIGEGSFICRRAGNGSFEAGSVTVLVRQMGNRKSKLARGTIWKLLAGVAVVTAVFLGASWALDRL